MERLSKPPAISHGALSTRLDALTPHLHCHSRSWKERAGTTPSRPAARLTDSPARERGAGPGRAGPPGTRRPPGLWPACPVAAPPALPAPAARPRGGRPRPNHLPGCGAYRRKEPALRSGTRAAASAPQRGGGCGARSPGLRLSRSRAAGKTVSLSYPLQNPPKHGLNTTRAAAVTLRTLRGTTHYSGVRERERLSREGTGEEVGARRWRQPLGRPGLPTGGERERAPASDEVACERPPAGRAAPVTDSWADPPVAATPSRPVHPRGAGRQGAWPGTATNRKRRRRGRLRDGQAAGRWRRRSFRRARGRRGGRAHARTPSEAVPAHRPRARWGGGWGDLGPA